jgi:hypothetical protein
MDLDQVLATLRKHGVSSAEVPGPGGVLRVVFEPSIAGPLPGDEPTPGGWKSPSRLDAPFDEAP